MSSRGHKSHTYFWEGLQVEHTLAALLVVMCQLRVVLPPVVAPVSPADLTYRGVLGRDGVVTRALPVAAGAAAAAAGGAGAVLGMGRRGDGGSSSSSSSGGGSLLGWGVGRRGPEG